MNEQWSYKEQTNGQGVIYLVATPIGNLEDITFRAVHVLKSVQVIAAEDTRHSRKLLTHFDIHPQQLISYHEHNKHSVGPKLVELVQSGLSVALVSDAGTPAIADPGYELVQLALQAEISVIPIPGANAALSALIASGQLPHPFVFFGFLPRENKSARVILEQCVKLRTFTLVFYESPHRLVQTLERLVEQLGDRSITLARELTKKHEQFLRGRISEMLTYYETNEVRGEFVLIIGQADALDDEREDAIESSTQWWATLSLEEHLAKYEVQGYPKKEAMKCVAKDRGLRKRDIYQSLLGSQEE